MCSLLLANATQSDYKISRRKLKRSEKLKIKEKSTYLFNIYSLDLFMVLIFVEITVIIIIANILLSQLALDIG
jgi:hypothetical protein